MENLYQKVLEIKTQHNHNTYDIRAFVVGEVRRLKEHYQKNTNINFEEKYKSANYKSFMGSGASTAHYFDKLLKKCLLDESNIRNFINGDAQKIIGKSKDFFAIYCGYEGYNDFVIQSGKPDIQMASVFLSDNYMPNFDEPSVIKETLPPKNLVLNEQPSASFQEVKESRLKIETNKIDPKALDGYIDELYRLYNITFQIPEGCKVAEKALKADPTNSDIIYWWVLFHNRDMQWITVRETLRGIVANVNIDEKTATVCYLGIFESAINEFIRERNYPRDEILKPLKKAKGKYLEKTPNKKSNSQYWYFLARYYEAGWWCIPDEKEKKSGMNFLDDAVKSINEALEIYDESSNKQSGYSGVPWWLYCHKAMLYKILDYSDFENTMQEFYDKIMPEIIKDENILKKSIYMYAATYYVLKNDADGLEIFLNKSIQSMTKRIEDLKLARSSKVSSSVESYPYHHSGMIFWKKTDKELKEKYDKIIQDFQKKCP